MPLLRTYLSGAGGRGGQRDEREELVVGLEEGREGSSQERRIPGAGDTTVVGGGG